MIYKCECCKYSTDDKSNFNKHNVSRKHKLLEKTEPAEIDLIEMIKLLNERLEKQEKQINEQKKQIDHIISEIF
jgi:hypothetical protein